jgi:hypothetical protein
MAMLHCASVMSGSFLSGYVVTETLLSQPPAEPEGRGGEYSLCSSDRSFTGRPAGLARFLP